MSTSIFEWGFEKCEWTDAVLLVAGKKLHVNKAHLSHHSDYFKTLFESNSSQNEFQINGVGMEEMAVMLSQTYDHSLIIMKCLTGDVIKLADRFQFPGVKRDVEQCIMECRQFSKDEQLALAKKYNLENVLEHLK